MAEHVPLYHAALDDAQRLDEVEAWRASYLENIRCRDFIGDSIDQNYDGHGLGGDTAGDAIAEFGFDRVNWVLSNTVQLYSYDGRISAENKAWAGEFYIPQDNSGKWDHRRDYAVHDRADLVDMVVRDARQAWAALRLFDKSHCLPFSEFQNVTGHLLALKPTALKESCRTPENQVFLAELGAGTVPTARGRMIGGKFLFDGEFAKFNREDFIGALKPEHFPEWAVEKMLEPEPEQAQEPVHIRVFQINKDRDIHGRCFMPLEGQAVDPFIYDEVYSGPVPDADPEAIFQQFNVHIPPLHRGWSMSPSDVIEVEGKYLFVDNFGFEEIPFDTSQTQKPEDLLRIVAIDPGYPAYEAEVGPDLQSMQRAVGGGLIEVTYPFGDNAVMVGNEEAKLIGMEGNRRIGGGVYAGPLFIVGDDGEGGFCSLTDEQTAGYCQEFAQPEDISMEEVQADTGMRFYGW